MARKKTEKQKPDFCGMVVRGADGEIYFLRDEILEATRVTEPEMKEFIESLAKGDYKADPQRFSMRMGAIDKGISYTGPFDKPQFDSVAASTVMCPGVMKDSAFRVNFQFDDDF